MKLYGTTVSLPVNMNVNVLLGSVLCSYWSVKLGVVILVLVAVLLLPMRSVPLIRDGTPLPSTSPSSPLRLLYCTLSSVNTTLHYSTVLPSSSPLFCSARRGSDWRAAAHCSLPSHKSTLESTLPYITSHHILISPLFCSILLFYSLLPDPSISISIMSSPPPVLSTCIHTSHLAKALAID